MSKYNTRFREQMNSSSKKNSKKSKSKVINNIKNLKNIKKKSIPLDEDIQDNSQMESDSLNNKSNNNPKKRKSRITIEPDEDNYSPQYHKIRMDEEEKLNEILENANFFNKNMLKSRIALNKEFLKKKIEYNYLREDKSQVFFNVPFFPKSEMFSNEQLLVKTNKNKFKLNNNKNIDNNNQNINSMNNSPINNNKSLPNINNNKFQLIQQQNIKISENPIIDKSVKNIMNNLKNISEEKQSKDKSVMSTDSKSLLDSSVINNKVHMIDLSHKKSLPRPTTFALFGLYKDNINVNKESNQTRHKNIFSSIFPNKNKYNNDDNYNEHKKYKNKGIIEIKEDDDEDSSSSNSYSSSRERNRRYKERHINKEDHKIETFKKLAERYKENKEILRKNIGDKKFYLLEQILIKKNYI